MSVEDGELLFGGISDKDGKVSPVKGSRAFRGWRSQNSKSEYRVWLFALGREIDCRHTCPVLVGLVDLPQA